MADVEQDAALAALTNAMFADEIATGAVIVDDPAPPAPVAVHAAPTPEPPAVAPVADVPPDPAPETAPVPTPEALPTFKPRLDDELQALLDEPDFDEEARLEVAAELESEEYDYADPETAATLKAQAKRIAFLEGQVVAKSKKGWIEEAKRAYPDLARLIPGEIEGITASSRRAFLREADKANTKYATVLGPTLARLEADRAAIATGMLETTRAEVAAAWGTPAADTLPSSAAATQEALAKARATGNLEEQIKVLMNDPTRPPVL